MSVQLTAGIQYMTSNPLQSILDDCEGQGESSE